MQTIVTISVEQAALVFLLNEHSTSFTIWDELVAEIKGGLPVLADNGLETWQFELYGIPYQILADDYVLIIPGAGGVADYSTLGNCPYLIEDLPNRNEITGALVNDELDELLDEIG